MSFYDEAYELYYRIRQAGYSVPIDFQKQMEELEELESKQFNIPQLNQPRVQPIGERYLRSGGRPVKQPKLPPIERLEHVKDDYIPTHVDKLKQPKFSLSERYIKSNIPTAEQEHLTPINTTGLLVMNNLRYQDSRAKVKQLEQPKLTKIENNTILKPYIRIKRKSWGSVSRTYHLNVASLKRHVLKRYKRPKLSHYETKGQDLTKLTAKLRRGLSHVKYIADIKQSDATPTAIYNMNFVYYYKVLVWQAFKQDIYAEMSKAQRKAFKGAWHQGMVSKTAIINFMVDKLIEYGGGDIRTTDEKAITRIVLANDLAVRRVYGNLKEVIAVGWEEYHQEKWNELHSQTTTAGAMLEKDVVDDLREDLKALEKVENAK